MNGDHKITSSVVTDTLHDKPDINLFSKLPCGDDDEDEVFFGPICSKEQQKAKRLNKRKTQLFVKGFRNARRSLAECLDYNNDNYDDAGNFCDSCEHKDLTPKEEEECIGINDSFEIYKESAKCLNTAANAEYGSAERNDKSNDLNTAILADTPVSELPDNESTSEAFSKLKTEYLDSSSQWETILECSASDFSDVRLMPSLNYGRCEQQPTVKNSQLATALTNTTASFVVHEKIFQHLTASAQVLGQVPSSPGTLGNLKARTKDEPSSGPFAESLDKLEFSQNSHEIKVKTASVSDNVEVCEVAVPVASGNTKCTNITECSNVQGKHLLHHTDVVDPHSQESDLPTYNLIKNRSTRVENEFPLSLPTEIESMPSNSPESNDLSPEIFQSSTQSEKLENTINNIDEQLCTIAASLEKSAAKTDNLLNVLGSSFKFPPKCSPLNNFKIFSSPYSPAKKFFPCVYHPTVLKHSAHTENAAYDESSFPERGYNAPTFELLAEIVPHCLVNNCNDSCNCEAKDLYINTEKMSEFVKNDKYRDFTNKEQESDIVTVNASDVFDVSDLDSSDALNSKETNKCEFQSENYNVPPELIPSMQSLSISDNEICTMDSLSNVDETGMTSARATGDYENNLDTESDWSNLNLNFNLPVKPSNSEVHDSPVMSTNFGCRTGEFPEHLSLLTRSVTKENLKPSAKKPLSSVRRMELEKKKEELAKLKEKREKLEKTVSKKCKMLQKSPVKKEGLFLSKDSPRRFMSEFQAPGINGISALKLGSRDWDKVVVWNTVQNSQSQTPGVATCAAQLKKTPVVIRHAPVSDDKKQSAVRWCQNLVTHIELPVTRKPVAHIRKSILLNKNIPLQEKSLEVNAFDSPMIAKKSCTLGSGLQGAYSPSDSVSAGRQLKGKPRFKF